MDAKIWSKKYDVGSGHAWIELRDVPEGSRAYTTKHYPPDSPYRPGRAYLRETKKFSKGKQAFVVVFESNTGNGHTTAFRDLMKAQDWLHDWRKGV